MPAMGGKRIRIWDGTVMATCPSMPPMDGRPNMDVMGTWLQQPEGASER